MVKMKMDPLSLYNICIEVAVTDCISACKFFKKGFRSLPNNVLFDFYHKMFQERRLCLLGAEFSCLDVFNRMLLVKHKRLKLLKSFQSLVDHCSQVPEDLIQAYGKCASTTPISDEDRFAIVDIGIRLGTFFNEGGWYNHSIKILDITETTLKAHKTLDIRTLKKYLDCYHKRIYAESIYCDFKAAESTYESAKRVVSKLQELGAAPNLAGLYANFSMSFFHRYEYNLAHEWSKEALRALVESEDELPTRIVVDVLRQASKACVMKRKFNQAGLLIRQAVSLDGGLFQHDGHPHYSDTLLDYGFYLLNFDAIKESVVAYDNSLHIRKSVFEKNNIQVALAYEDMAYAQYVNEYSSGRFYTARDYAERSIRILERILPADHLCLSSAKRVKALILEEIALDMRADNESKNEYFVEAETLHKSALTLSFKAFGECNVQTAKHYANLGRLYQSMCMYNEAEQMHLRAIALKEEILGADDYEVGLSMGHLASLYNYHMERYQDAEQLYKRSMDINLKLFGEAYSGFEYDYRGLINVYEKQNDFVNLELYNRKMQHWKMLRGSIKPLHFSEAVVPIKQIVDKFFSMC